VPVRAIEEVVVVARVMSLLSLKISTSIATRLLGTRAIPERSPMIVRQRRGKFLPDK
jgi:hypothetical protein